MTKLELLLNITNDRVNYTMHAENSQGCQHAVSQMHGEVSEKMWSGHDDICEIKSITMPKIKSIGKMISWKCFRERWWQTFSC